ncbi:MAG: phosphate regulon transcriptional regulator PhoB [Sinobacterium sp.]|nr:phosphate regulon transcriptional regulator PhoB [Sinobacterium sp.]
MSQLKILVVDDEQAIRDMLRMTLELADFECFEAENTQQALNQVHDVKPDLILLDWMLPGGSGIEFLHKLKKQPACAEIPVIMLTAKTSEDNKIQGLDVGADDYVTKPFSPRELVARIKALLRRLGFYDGESSLQLEGVKVEHSSRRVLIDGEGVSMGPTEYNLLYFFITHQNRVYSRSQLLDHVWGNNSYVEERTVDVHIRRLRKALAVDSGADYGHLVQTVRGAGYRFSAV